MQLVIIRVVIDTPEYLVYSTTT